MNATNFSQIGDYRGFKEAFLQLNGFKFEDIDYNACVDIDSIVSKHDS